MRVLNAPIRLLVQAAEGTVAPDLLTPLRFADCRQPRGKASIVPDGEGRVGSDRAGPEGVARAFQARELRPQLPLGSKEGDLRRQGPIKMSG